MKDNSTSLNSNNPESSYTKKQGNHFTDVVQGVVAGDLIKSRELNANDTAGVVGKPSFGGGEPNNNIATLSADVTNAEAKGEANITASEANLSAKYKRPSVSQDQGSGGSQWNTPQ